MNLALGTIAIGVALFLARRPLARSVAATQATWFDRSYDVDGLAWWSGALGQLVAAFGAVFAAVALRG